MSEAAPTFTDLISPFTDAEFLGLLQKRELAYRPGLDGARYKSLVGWQALRRLIDEGNYPKTRDAIRVTRESVAAPPERWMTDGKVDPAKLDELLAKGFSVVIVPIEPHVPALAAICDEIRSQTHEGARVGAIVTSGTAGGAFKIHYDPEDLLIVQVEGTKRWQIFGPPVPNALRGMPKQSAPENAEPIFDEVLEAGDLLFVPAGNWHHCESGLSTSVHLGVFFFPPTGWHATKELLDSVLSEEMFRTPLTRLDGQPSLEAMEAEVKSRLIEKIGELKLNEFLPGWPKKAY